MEQKRQQKIKKCKELKKTIKDLSNSVPGLQVKSVI